MHACILQTAAPTTTGTSGGPIAEESDEVGLEPTGPVLRTNSRSNSSDPAGTTASASTSAEADGMSDQRTTLGRNGTYTTVQTRLSL